MKRFMKVSLMTAGILGALGFAFCLIGGIVSGRNFLMAVKNDVHADKRLAVVERVFEGVERGIGASKSGKTEIYVEDSSHSAPDKLTVNNSETTESGYEHHIETEGIRELNVSLGAGICTISEKDEADGLIDLYVNGKGGFNFYIKDSTLYVEGFKGNQLFNVNQLDNEMTLRIPRGMGFEEMDLEIGAGIMEIDNLKAKEFDAVIGAGELGINKAEIIDFSVEIGAGNLVAGDMHVRGADLEVDLGNCSYEGIIEQELDAECNMGSMDFLLKGKEKDYNYEIECSAGNVEINGWEFTALGTEKYVNNGAAATFELTCSMGNITLDFVEE